MNSSLIGKIQKARRYAQEPERAQFQSLHVQFQGGHDVYDVRLDDREWSCNCHTYESLGTCSHIMTMERLLAAMIPADVEASDRIPVAG
ncbi:MAG: hypothetical protein EA415_05200 [Sphaerobacteraceae bacterium]|nr:MAG: hypothetical protein EA415_05200 [Sphaerobacteraceae bacterium]